MKKIKKINSINLLHNVILIEIFKTKWNKEKKGHYTLLINWRKKSPN